LPLEATGAEFLNEIFVFRFAGGRVAETWGVVDVFSQMQKLGVIPAQRT
jgi:hypothetical protein